MSSKPKKRSKTNKHTQSSKKKLSKLLVTSADASDTDQAHEYGIADFRDLTVVLQRGAVHQYQVHKVKLAEQCNYFKALLLSGQQLSTVTLPASYN